MSQSTSGIECRACKRNCASIEDYNNHQCNPTTQRPSTINVPASNSAASVTIGTHPANLQPPPSFQHPPSSSNDSAGVSTRGVSTLTASVSSSFSSAPPLPINYEHSKTLVRKFGFFVGQINPKTNKEYTWQEISALPPDGQELCSIKASLPVDAFPHQQLFKGGARDRGAKLNRLKLYCTTMIMFAHKDAMKARTSHPNTSADDIVSSLVLAMENLFEQVKTFVDEQLAAVWNHQLKALGIVANDQAMIEHVHSLRAQLRQKASGIRHSDVPRLRTFYAGFFHPSSYSEHRYHIIREVYRIFNLAVHPDNITVDMLRSSLNRYITDRVQQLRNGISKADDRRYLARDNSPYVNMSLLPTPQQPILNGHNIPPMFQPCFGTNFHGNSIGHVGQYGGNPPQQIPASHSVGTESLRILSSAAHSVSASSNNGFPPTIPVAANANHGSIAFSGDPTQLQPPSLDGDILASNAYLQHLVSGLPPSHDKAAAATNTDGSNHLHPPNNVVAYSQAANNAPKTNTLLPAYTQVAQHGQQTQTMHQNGLQSATNQNQSSSNSSITTQHTQGQESSRASATRVEDGPSVPRDNATSTTKTTLASANSTAGMVIGIDKSVNQRNEKQFGQSGTPESSPTNNQHGAKELVDASKQGASSASTTQNTSPSKSKSPKKAKAKSPRKTAVPPSKPAPSPQAKVTPVSTKRKQGQSYDPDDLGRRKKNHRLTDTGTIACQRHATLLKDLMQWEKADIKYQKGNDNASKLPLFLNGNCCQAPTLIHSILERKEIPSRMKCGDPPAGSNISDEERGRRSLSDVRYCRQCLNEHKRHMLSKKQLPYSGYYHCLPCHNVMLEQEDGEGRDGSRRRSRRA